MKLLFTSVGRRVELIQAFKKAAENNNIELSVYGADMDMTAPALLFCDETKQLPRIKSDEYIPTLLKICDDNKINAVIPTIDTDLQILADNKKEFERIGTKVIISDPEKIRICRDKRITAEYFVNAGLNSPMPVDDIEKYDGGFPAFIKPKDGSSSIFAYKCDDLEDLRIKSKHVPDYIIQPFISGKEYTVDIMCDFDGNPIFITPRQRLAVRSGEVLKTQIDNDSKIIEEIKSFLKHYKPCGAVTVQLITEDKTGDNYYIEINPRFGGGAPLSMKAGADSAEALLKLLGGESIGYQENAAENGAVFSRFDQSVRVK